MAGFTAIQSNNRRVEQREATTRSAEGIRQAEKGISFCRHSKFSHLALVPLRETFLP
jgi:hypothetical protein